MATGSGQIPGLYSSDKGVDWSSDSLPKDPDTRDNSNVDVASQGQNNSGVHGTEKNHLISQLRREKDGLALNFVHSRRLLDEGG